MFQRIAVFNKPLIINFKVMQSRKSIGVKQMDLNQQESPTRLTAKNVNSNKKKKPKIEELKVVMIDEPKEITMIESPNEENLALIE